MHHSTPGVLPIHWWGSHLPAAAYVVASLASVASSLSAPARFPPPVADVADCSVATAVSACVIRCVCSLAMNVVCWAATTRIDDVLYMVCACTGPPSSTCRISCGNGSRIREVWSAARTSGQRYTVTSRPHVHAWYETDGHLLDV